MDRLNPKQRLAVDVVKLARQRGSITGPEAAWLLFGVDACRSSTVRRRVTRAVELAVERRLLVPQGKHCDGDGRPATIYVHRMHA